METLQTEFDFTLRYGYIDSDGTVHKQGTMRLATAADELWPQRDPRVKENPAYLPVIVLSMVVTRLGTLEMITTNVIENLFSQDFAFLQDFYNKINQKREPGHELG